MTFSIVACDLDSDPQLWGVAVASKFLGVGSVVPFVRAGVGAIATQAFANVRFGPDGLEMLSSGRDAASVVLSLTDADDERAQRQLGVVDSHGIPATFTGDDCFEWAGGRTGESYCCQGNILVGAEVVDAMAAAFESTAGDLATRLLAALAAGDLAGGDRRGRQSAAIVVAGAGAGYLGGSDIAVDLRVDDHPQPVEELARLVDLHRFYFPIRSELQFVPIDAAVAAELRYLLREVGLNPGGGDEYDDELRRSLMGFVGTENLEERWSDEPVIEAAVLDYLRSAGS